MKAAILMPCYNRAEFTYIAAPHLIRMLREKRPVIFVNDGSTDATETVLNGLGYRGKIIVTHESNRGLPVAYNAAFQEADRMGCEVAILVDNDLMVPYDFDASLLEGIEANDKVAVAGLVVNDRNVIKFLRKHPEILQPGVRYATEAVGGGAAVAIRLEMWRQVGGFEERRGSFAYTDARFFGRARQMGWKTLVDPRVICFELQQIAYTDLTYEIEKLKKRLSAKLRRELREDEIEKHWPRWMAGRVRVVGPWEDGPLGKA